MRAPYLDGADTKFCTGCSACAFACPTKAISMIEDVCGFVYPTVDEDACVQCGRCLSACHMAASDDLKSKDVLQAYGAYVKDCDQLMRSASGGVATSIALTTVREGGIVYGCVADREDVRHDRLTTPEKIERSRGSKYVQSDISRAIPQIADDLNSGVWVVFIGAPCQCAALRRLFGARDNLLLIDLVCEGVPSQRMYADFLDELERERGVRVTDFRFRDKRGGWSTKNAVVVGEDEVPLGRQPHSYYYYYYYYYLFTHALILRDSCYACPYACCHRVGDVTIGDFWGAETSRLGYSLRELRGGVSCVLANTGEGSRVVEAISGGFDMRPCAFEAVARSNSCLIRPSVCDVGERGEVLAAYESDGAVGMKRWYGKRFDSRARAKANLAASLPLWVRVTAKRALQRLRDGR